MSYFCRFQLCRECSIRPLLISISVIFFIVVLSFISVHHSRILLQSAKFSDINKINGEPRWLGEVAKGSESPMLLAKSRTHRKDPINAFKYYNGGWDITSGHYWASLAYSALPLFVIAEAWFIFFGLTLFVTCICCCCCPRKPRKHSPTYQSLSLYIFTFFTIASIAACIGLYFGQEKFHHSTQDTLDYIVTEVGETAQNLTTVVSYLSSAMKIGVQGLGLPEDIQNMIIDIQQKADSSGKFIHDETQHNRKRIRKVVNIVRDTLIGLASLMLLLAISGFLLTLCESRFLVYILATVSWILITGTIILSGVFLVLHNMMGDTCVAMDEWVRNPSVYTTLDDILPCLDKGTAEDILQKSKGINQQLVSLVDTAITNASNGNFQPSTGPPLFYNQSGPLLPLLCSPYNPDLTDRTCAPGEVDFANATEVWKKYVCKVGVDNATCTTTGRLTPAYYEQAVNVGNVSYGLYTYTPFLVQLADCTFVHNTCEHISNNYCWGLQRYTTWIYINLALVSFFSIFSLFCWLIYARERSQRSSNR